MKYHFITNLPSDWETIVSGRLGALADVWKEQSAKLKDNHILHNFNEKLYRRWAVETGIIEKIYDIDRGTTEILVEQGFVESLISHGSTDKSAGFVIDTLNAHREAIDFLFDFIRRDRILSNSFIKELHALLAKTQNTTEGRDQFGNRFQIELIKGKWKDNPNNPTRPDGQIYEYCPPEHVQSEMDNLLKWHQEHLVDGVPPEIEAAWLHHRFTQIHPFQDGNGRVARALASLVLIKNGLFPLVIPRGEKEKYISALEEADKGKIDALVHLFEAIQQNEIKKALSLVVDVEQEKQQKDIILSISNKIKAKRHDKINKVIGASAFIADMLLQTTKHRLLNAEGELNNVFQENDISGEYKAFSHSSNSQNDHWFKKQIVDIAKMKEYFADTKTYRSWCRLTITDGTQLHVIFSFHCLGYEFSGTMCVSGFLFERFREEEGGETQPSPLTDDIFIYTYEDKLETVKRRFARWLDEALLVALAHFKEQI